MFVPERWDSALLFPPLRAGASCTAARAGNASGVGCGRGSPGVHLVEATKTLYGAPNPVPAGRRKQVLARATG